jgi:hypothetical protein
MELIDAASVGLVVAAVVGLVFKLYAVSEEALVQATALALQLG